MEMYVQPNTPCSTANPRGGVDVHFDLSSDLPLQQSPTWAAGGRRLTFVRLASGQTLSLPSGTNFIKVILGRLANIDRSCLAPAFAVRSTAVAADEVTAGDDGALFALVNMEAGAPQQIASMKQLEFQGLHNEILVWQTFADRFAGRTDFFDGKDCYMADGIHLLDDAGEEIVYLNPWTCGKGVDLSTHNHGHPPSDMNPAFAEVHWVMAASTDGSGMYQTAEPGAAQRQRYPMKVGDEHGPFYDLDANGRPRRRDNGAVQYPWHGWQGGDDGDAGQRYDFVLAFEINPDMIEAGGSSART